MTLSRVADSAEPRLVIASSRPKTKMPRSNSSIRVTKVSSVVRDRVKNPSVQTTQATSSRRLCLMAFATFKLSEELPMNARSFITDYRPDDRNIVAIAHYSLDQETKSKGRFRTP